MSMNKHIEDELLINYLLGECSAEEKIEVEKWLAESEKHQAHYKQFSLIWEQSKNIISNVEVDEDAAWQRLQQRMKRGKVVRMYRMVGAMAASVIFVLGLFWFFNTNKNDNSNPQFVKTSKPTFQIIHSSQQGLIDTLIDKLNQTKVFTDQLHTNFSCGIFFIELKAIFK